jgi:tetratricopeptide (TPR) repeat protein
MKAEEFFNQAHSDLVQGDFQNALQNCQAGLRHQANPAGWHLLALIQRQLQGPQAALVSLEQALKMTATKLDANLDAELHNSQGNLLSEIGALTQAKQAYKAALVLRPDYGLAWLNLARLCEELGDLAQALKAYLTLLELEPTQPAALLGAGEILRRQRAWQEAEMYFQRGLQLPNLEPQAAARFWTQLGVLLHDQGHLKAAEHAHRQALQLAPDLADAWFNLGSVLQEKGDFQAAYNGYQAALQSEPELAEAQLNLALLNLAAENWVEGFAGLRWRQRCMDWRGQIPMPLWQGESLEQKTLLVESEYGQGDILLFLRFLKGVPAAQILLRCPASFKALIEQSSIVQESIEQEPRIKALLPHESANWDRAIRLFDLPHLLKQTPLEHAPPYLRLATPPKQNTASARRIGFCWHGQPPEQHPLPTAQRMAARKTLPLKGFVECAKAFSEDHFLSLQWPPEPQALQAFPQLEDLSQAIQNWHDTAYLIQDLDLLISADTAVAHLAGALNKPVWVLLPTPVYWFWPARGTDFKWYPSMRLFRQKTPGDWESVFAEVQSALKNWQPERLKKSKNSGF